MNIVIDSALLTRLAQANHFELPDDPLIFFGIRGAIPLSDNHQQFAASHTLSVCETDHNRLRCTLGQWRRHDAQLALFLGSTVPHLSYIKRALSAGGAGANMLVPGFYSDYRKGIHNQNKLTGHAAFRQNGARPVIRSCDDLDFDQDDRIDVENPGDNLHAAWSMGGDLPYSSAGCQVVMGFPACLKPGHGKDLGDWAIFKANAYALANDRFSYMLLPAIDYQRASTSPDSAIIRLRFGSRGNAVRELQAALAGCGFYEGIQDGEFGPRTARAVLAFQQSRFGQADGVVGPVTAAALNLQPDQL